jgi:hypothetical protein
MAPTPEIEAALARMVATSAEQRVGRIHDVQVKTLLKQTDHRGFFIEQLKRGDLDDEGRHHRDHDERGQRDVGRRPLHLRRSGVPAAQHGPHQAVHPRRQRRQHLAVDQLRPRAADLHLFVGGRDRSKLAEAMTWQVDAVRAVVSERSDIPVIPVLCFLDADWPLFGGADEYRGVRLDGPKTLRKAVSRPGPLTEEEIVEVAVVLSHRLPPYAVEAAAESGGHERITPATADLAATSRAPSDLVR